MDLQKYKLQLQEVRRQLECAIIDEIPLDARPQMPDFDFDKDSYVVVSYSRKDFEQVYLFLAYLYNSGYRFWYDNGMKGTEKWLNEYKNKFLNPNCLGTITFFSDNYISDSTKEELSIIYNQGSYVKQNVMISLVSLASLDPQQVLINAMANGRITIPNANAILPLLTKLIEEEKEKTIYRYSKDSEISFLADKIGSAFNIRSSAKNEEQCMLTEHDEQTQQYSDINDFVIRDNVLIEYTGNKAFVAVPEGITCIEGGVFQGNTSVAEVSIPDSVTSIGMCAFRNCGALKKVTLSSNLTSIEICAFDGCVSLESITIPSGVTQIGSDSFEMCRSLQEISIPEGVTRIGAGAFNCCDSLKQVAIPGSITEIGAQAFFRCDSLFAIMFHGTIEQWASIHKDNHWNFGACLQTIICLDGTISLD